MFFLTGTGTDIGKTLIATWLCLHTKADYWKVIQTGAEEYPTDSHTVAQYTTSHIHPEYISLQEPASPHSAAEKEEKYITLASICIPKPCSSHIIIEGAGGVCVPINSTHLMTDLILHFAIPVIIVASSSLGTINHTLLTISYLEHKSIAILGVILNGTINEDNKNTIEHFTKIPVLAQFPYLDMISTQSLLAVPIGEKLKRIFI